MHLSDKCGFASSASIIIGSLLRLVGVSPNPLDCRLHRQATPASQAKNCHLLSGQKEKTSKRMPFPYLLCVTNMLLHDIEVPNIYHMNSLKHNLLDYTDDDKFDVILMNPPYGGHEDKSIQGFFPDDLASSETADLFMSVIMYRLKKTGRAAVVVPDGFLFGLDNAKVVIKTKLLTEFNLHTVIRLPGSVFSPYTSISTNLLFFDNTKPTKDTWFYRVDMPSDRKHFSKTKPMELKHFDNAIAWWNDRKEITLEDGPKAQKFTAEFLLNYPRTDVRGFFASNKYGGSYPCCFTVSGIRCLFLNLI